MTRTLLCALLLTALALPAGAAEHAAGLPQLDPSHYSAQIFWLLVHFVVLYLLMAKLVLPRFADILGTRQQRLAEDLGTADTAQKEATAARTGYEQALSGARAEAHQLRQAALAAARAEQTAAEEKLAAELAVASKAAGEKLAVARAGLEGHLREVAATAARDIVTKVGLLEPDRAAVENAVSRILSGTLKEVA